MTSRDIDSADESASLWLRGIIAALLNVEEDEIPTGRPLGELGIDSLTAAELSVQIEDHTGANIPLEGFLGKRTLDDVARELVDVIAVTDIGTAR